LSQGSDGKYVILEEATVAGASTPG